MNKLLLDIGNTSLKMAVANSSKLLSVQRCEAFTEEVLDALIHTYSPKIALVASVRKEYHEELDVLRKRFKKVIAFDSRTPVPIRNLYATPDTLGADRLATAVGANSIFPQSDCLIIDCGTAITIDFLSSYGEFIGGNISPGLQTRFKALHHFTGRLPMGHVRENVATIGKSTLEAIEAGVIQGTLNEIEGYIEQYAKNIAIITGGDAFYFAKKIKKPIFAIPNLNFIGLAKIADYNAYI